MRNSADRKKLSIEFGMLNKLGNVVQKMSYRWPGLEKKSDKLQSQGTSVILICQRAK